MLALLRSNRDLRALFCAQTISFAGDWFAVVAVLGALDDLTGSAIVVSSFWVAQSLPILLVTPLAGSIADRFDRRRIIVVVSLLQAMAALLFLGVGPHRWALAFVAEAGVASLGAFVMPAASAALPNLVPPQDLARASTLMSGTWGAMAAAGSALGGAFTVLFGRNASYVADAVSFLLAAAIVATIRTPTRGDSRSPASGRPRPVRDSVAALRLARQRPVLVAFLLSKGGYGLASGAVGLLAVLATERYGGGAGATGLLLGVRGAGAVVGPVLATRLIGHDASTATLLRLCGVTGFVFALGYGIAAAAPVFVIAAAGVFIGHLGGGTQWTLSTYGLQRESPDEIRGRLLSADFALVTLTMSVSFLAAGLLEASLGASGTIALLGGVSALWAAAYLVAQRRLGVTGRRPSSEAARSS